MNPDDNANQPSAPNNPNQPATNPMPPLSADDTPQGPGLTPPVGQEPTATPNDSTSAMPGASAPQTTPTNPGVTPTVDTTPVSPTGDTSGPYGAGTMQQEPTPTMPTEKPVHPINKRRTGMVLLLLIIVALAAAAWLMVQAFSG